jgi:integrase/recombinase XerD
LTDEHPQRIASCESLRMTCCHTFRATGITTYLQNGGTIEHAQQIANHESPRTTKLYDRTYDAISLDEIERILI